MKALIHDPGEARGLRLGEVAEPRLTSGQAVIQVHAVSLNFGELAFLAQMHRPGEVPGWDASGVVVQAAADGTGPREGTRVSTFGRAGAWAERRAVDTSEIGLVPDGVDLGAASALPVAGVTALRALRSLGAILGRRVLVTGASGGVGRFAVQLAHRAGAQVIACVGAAARGEGLLALGADEVVVGLEGVDLPVDGVIENVGGPTLARAFALVAKGGSLQSVGMASLEPSTVDLEPHRLSGGDRRLEVFTVGADFGGDLTYLLSLVAQGRLEVPIGWRGSWERAGEASAALLGRRISGKAVLDVRED
jgi:NADPH:quinone reductase